MRASLIAQLVKNLPAMQETLVNSRVGKIRWRRERLPTPVFLGSPGGSAGKESACNAGDLGSIPGLGRSPGEGKGYPLLYSSLEISMDCIVHGLTKSWTLLNDFHSHLFTFDCAESYLLLKFSLVLESRGHSVEVCFSLQGLLSLRFMGSGAPAP